MKKSAGFTLIELMIVVAIIAIIAAIAIPNLLRSRLQSNESAAIGNLRTINGAETAFHSANSQYAQTFDALTTATPPFLDGTAASWTAATGKQGYVFTLGAPAAGGTQNYAATAVPVTYQTTGNRSFFTQADGVVRGADKGGAAADASDPPV
ncbi:MAG TPA: prepilin-type N-terminal cleavage/methylation domain-containing protein [Candidatus Hydrogenedentes bacterium]|nr:prepilin-type N-terminal cleavage/methylation domain-containing protein [Candidatus Hydrogenedentota bacterium]HPC14961.1 prepilin-type N-terminal cleavage/methylation domain-containing protein [Candidatus Hydrogenedentota bacterium]HRT19178.1 prepilin-type N-terminal cleavage/methylation domain-containing protein [Candidatus Hydrogenedentota bacterium]HRT64107.1 prepilin-type N-terminal cleavage/methylation domain-containing protein [Candidatus Hydrogenedentota bacterium]